MQVNVTYDKYALPHRRIAIFIASKPFRYTVDYFFTFYNALDLRFFIKTVNVNKQRRVILSHGAIFN